MQIPFGSSGEHAHVIQIHANPRLKRTAPGEGCSNAKRVRSAYTAEGADRGIGKELCPLIAIG